MMILAMTLAAERLAAQRLRHADGGLGLFASQPV